MSTHNICFHGEIRLLPRWMSLLLMAMILSPLISLLGQWPYCEKDLKLLACRVNFQAFVFVC